MWLHTYDHGAALALVESSHSIGFPNDKRAVLLIAIATLVDQPKASPSRAADSPPSKPFNKAEYYDCPFNIQEERTPIDNAGTVFGIPQDKGMKSTSRASSVNIQNMKHSN